MSQSFYNGGPPDSDDVNGAQEGGAFDGGVDGQAFVREDRDGEVRLHFRDVPAGQLAVSFRRSGAGLISMHGSRARLHASEQDPHDAPVAWGEVTVRYFYLMNDVVYTVNIAVPSGVVQSVASVYPNAALSERDLHNRLGITFVSAETAI